MARASVLSAGQNLAQAEFTSAEHFYKMVFSAAKPHPKPKPSASGFGLERSRKGAGEGCPHLGVPSLSGLCGDEVDVGDNGNISQFFVPHTSHFLLHAIKTAPARPLCFNGPEPGSARSDGRARSVHIPTNFRSDVILYRSLLGKATNLQKISHKFVPSFSWRLLAEKRNPGEIYVENSVESVENPKTCSTVLDRIEHLLYSCHTNMRLIF